MIAALRERIAVAVQEAAENVIGEPIAVPAVEDPPRPELGDLALPVALQLARQVGRKPREIAAELRQRLLEHPIKGVKGWEVSGPGFLNVSLDRGQFLLDLLSSLSKRILVAGPCKVVVEHTSINPNKAAHIGHLRNACIGDVLARVMRYLGHTVEVHNYIDDTGVQVADVVIGFMALRGMDAAAVKVLDDPFDFTCWDLYTEVNRAMVNDSDLQDRRRSVLRALEQGDGTEKQIARVIVDRIVGRHLRTMGRLDIYYDLLVREGDILALDLWSEAFERLRPTQAVYFADQGNHAGCWMMRLRGAAGFEDLEEADKVLVRSNGVATYVAKDIAYHFWKYGRLQRDFRYAAIDIDGERAVWQTTAGDGEARRFGSAEWVINVIDVRQSYLQSIVAEALRLVDQVPLERFTHFAYEMVALSPATAVALGLQTEAEDGDRAFVEMSGRRGVGVKADDLLDALEQRAAAEVAQRNPDMSRSACQQIGRVIASGAARYFLLRFTRTTVIVFDFDEALSFEGETGPYLQYAAVRARSIFEKLTEHWGVPAEDVARALAAGKETAEMGALGIDFQDAAELHSRLGGEDGGEMWSLVLLLARFDEVAEQAVSSLELSMLAKYVFALAQQFNRFYHRYPILREADPGERSLRLLVAYVFRRQLATALDLLGIDVPARM